MRAVVTTIIGPLVVNAPLIAALVVGLILTLKRRQQNPQAARLVIAALILAFAAILLSAALQGISGILAATHIEINQTTVTVLYGIANVMASLLTAAAWIMAAIALVRPRRLAGRTQP